MKKILSVTIMLFLFSSLLVSCSEDDSYVERENKSNEVLNYKFTYNGKTYSLDYVINLDSTISYRNESAGQILNKLINEDNYVIYVNTNNEIIIYDNFESFKKDNVSTVNNKVDPNNPISYTGPEATIRIHKDANLLGQSVTFTKLYGGSHISVPNLGNYGINDEMTSFYARIPFGGDVPFKIVFYRDHNFLGASIVFNNWYTDNIWNETSIHVNNIGIYQIPGSNRNWNDEVTSIKTIP